MKEKLIEEWLINARERGGIDQALGQLLVFEGHEILQIGHSPYEFGKDIITIDSNGAVNAFQVKDEDLDTNEMRKIEPQIRELIQYSPVHPRVQPGAKHIPYLVTSGLINQVTAAKIRALNETSKRRKDPALIAVDRHSLIKRFVKMSDSFWPTRPSDIRDFFGFYLAEGKGDFDAAKFSKVLKGLLGREKETLNQKAQRVAAVGLLGNHLMQAFEREGDHWSLFRGWTLIAAHIAWYAQRDKLPQKLWVASFKLAKDAAFSRLLCIAKEAMEPEGLTPKDFEMDDYTRARNLRVCAVISLIMLTDDEAAEKLRAQAFQLVRRLTVDLRLFYTGEAAFHEFLPVFLFLEKQGEASLALKLLENLLSDLCRCNRRHSIEEPIDLPDIEVDLILERLFLAKEKAGGASTRYTRTAEPLVQMLARRDQRNFLEQHWRDISRLSLILFKPTAPEDLLLWHCNDGSDFQVNFEATQSWGKLRVSSANISVDTLPDQLKLDAKFTLMFALAYPHRVSPELCRLIDRDTATPTGCSPHHRHSS